MRTLSSAATTLLTNKLAIKPLLLVKIYWLDNPVIYGTKQNDEFNVQGKLLLTSSIDDVITLTGSSNSVNLSMQLDDADLSLKTIFNNTNIHGVKVDVLQWFEDFHIADAFVIFQGEIATPLSYNEKAKILSFDIINRLEDREIGFSIEEGQFSLVPAGTVGRMWPLAFGTVASVPGLQIAEPPSAVFAEGTGVVVDDAWDAELLGITTEIERAYVFEMSEFILGLQEAYKAAEERSANQVNNTADDPFANVVSNSHDEAAQQHFRQADQYRRDRFELGLVLIAKNEERAAQKKYETPYVHLIASNLPVNVPLQLKVNDAVFTGTFNGNVFSIASRDVPAKINRGSNVILTTNTDTLATFNTPETREKFYWVDGGSQVKALNFPLKYIIGLQHLTVLNVKAKQNNVFVKVPAEYYSIALETFGTLQATTLTMFEPLTSKNDEITKWESDELFFDVVSPVGDNVVDVMIYLITNFTSQTYDAATFNHVRTLVNGYPVNFVLTERANTFDVLKDIAFQSRCLIWINDRKFYLRYLPEEQTQVDTISETDVFDDEEVNIEITTTDSESIVTKFVAEWKADQTQTTPFQIVYRYNVERFGVKEEVYNFYIYNNIESVKKSAEFWSIQKANLWKIAKFSVFLQKIKLETFDPVLLNFTQPILSNDPVVGVIERGVYNAERNIIELEVRLPVRFGEMDKYVFAAPKDVTEKYPVAGDRFTRTGNPLTDATGNIVGNDVFLTASIVGLNTLIYRGVSAGRDEIIGDSGDSFEGITTILDPNEIISTRPSNLSRFNDVVKYDVKTPKAIDKPASNGTAAYMGYVLERFDGSLYYVSAFLNGLAEPAKTIIAEQFAHPEDDEITVNTPCVVYSGKGTLETTKYLMFVPTWMQQSE